MRARRVATIAVLALAALCPTTGFSQERLGVQTELLFYGDNTEFSNPFREGETIFGAAIRVAGVVDLNDRVRLSIGGFGNQRFGSEKSFEQVRPVLSLTIRGKRSSFVFGTLPGGGLRQGYGAQAGTRAVGPDHDGPHDLLPPLQRETLAFDRPYEAGLAWRFTGRLVDHEFWLNWQRLNTPDHRERFDGGLNASLLITERLTFPVQLHVLHEGGQLHQAGPVADSVGLATGAKLQHSFRGYLGLLELFGLMSRDVPDRSRSDLTTDGSAFFGRASAERSGWRAHVLFWRGRDFVKAEGDLNYLSIERDAKRYRGTRDYSEAGLSRRFRLAPAAILDVSGRLHRIESHYEYSFRIKSVVSSFWVIR
jgi:hypothetical protein